jgi:hypothetical protein
MSATTRPTSPTQPPRPRRTSLTPALLALTGALALLPLSGCGGDGDPAHLDASPSPTRQVDEDTRLPALFALVESHHRQADLAIDQGDLPAAVTSMTALIADLNAATLDHPERLLFLIDAHTRLARLQTQQGHLTEALATIDAGLRWHYQTPHPTLFGGYLLQTKGDLLYDLHDDRGAIQAHKEAILVFKSIIDSTP